MFPPYECYSRGEQRHWGFLFGRIFKETIFPQIENYCGSNKDVLGSLLGTDLRDKVIYGFEISDDEIISYLSSLKNSRVVTA